MQFSVEREGSFGDYIAAAIIDAPEFEEFIWNGQYGVEEFAHAEKGWSKLMVSRALAALGLDGARGRMSICGDVIEFRVFGSRDRVFIFPREGGDV